MAGDCAFVSNDVRTVRADDRVRPRLLTSRPLQTFDASLDIGLERFHGFDSGQHAAHKNPDDDGENEGRQVLQGVYKVFSR